MKKLVTSVAALAVAIPLTASAAPRTDLPEQAAARIFDAALVAAQAAQSGMPEHAQGNLAQGNPGHATGLARAQEMIAAHATNGNGKGLGRGHSADVIAALLGGENPSGLAGHGREVSAVAKATAALAGIDRPGRGYGPGGDGAAEDDDQD